MTNGREFSVIAEGHYRLALLREGLMLDVKRLRWERGELLGLLVVAADFAGAKVVDGILSMGTFNLTSVSARATRAKELASRAHAPEIDFGQLLEELCQRAIRVEEAGRPLILLRQVQPLAEDVTDRLTIADFPILRRHPSILFGDGGTGKSTLALYMAGELERRGVSTLYLDWEMDEYDHRDQLERLFGADDMPDVKYRRCDRPLVLEGESITEQVRDCGIEFVICDSVMFACDGPPESAEVAGRYFRALRQLKVGSLNLAHVTKGEGNDKRPFGSAFWFNGVRACWYAEQADSSGSDSIHVGVFNRKLTRGRKPPAVGFDIRYTGHNGPITVTSANVADNEQLAAHLPLGTRMRHVLRGGALTVAQIAEELEAKVDSVTKVVDRDRGRWFVRVLHPDGVHRWGLVQPQAVA